MKKTIQRTGLFKHLKTTAFILPFTLLFFTIFTDQISKYLIRDYFTPPQTISQAVVRQKLLRDSVPVSDKKIFRQFYNLDKKGNQYRKAGNLTPKNRRALAFILKSNGIWQEPAPISLVGSFFWINFHENSGVAFGMLSGIPPSIAIPVFALITLAALVFLIHFYCSVPPEKIFLKTSLILIMGGAIGNLIDRIIIGRVTDFLDFAVYTPHYKNIWPLFNLADAYIVIGVTALIIMILFDAQKSVKKQQKEQTVDPDS